MNFTHNLPPPVKTPPSTINLELTEREFAMLYDLVRSVRGIDVAMSANEALQPEVDFTGTEAANMLHVISNNGNRIINKLNI